MEVTCSSAVNSWNKEQKINKYFWGVRSLSFSESIEFLLSIVQVQLIIWIYIKIV